MDFELGMPRKPIRSNMCVVLCGYVFCSLCVCVVCVCVCARACSCFMYVCTSPIVSPKGSTLYPVFAEHPVFGPRRGTSFQSYGRLKMTAWIIFHKLPMTHGFLYRLLYRCFIVCCIVLSFVLSFVLSLYRLFYRLCYRVFYSCIVCFIVCFIVLS